MILIAFDLETSGLDVVKDRPIEVGAILYTTGQKRILETQGYLVKTDVSLTPETTKLTGLTSKAIETFGVEPEFGLNVLLDLVKRADAFATMNGIRFDRRILHSWASRHKKDFPEKPWIDLMTDLPADVEPKKLSYMAADHGFLNLFPHGAVTDCLTVIKILESYDIEEVLKRAQTPTVIAQAKVTFDTNQLAKNKKFRWNPSNKIWWKAIKTTDVDKFASECDFDLKIREDLNLEDLDN